MSRGGSDIVGASVNSEDIEAHSRHRLGEQAASATDIDKREPAERCKRSLIAAEMGSSSAADESKPQWVETVQCGERALWIPPLFGERRELLRPRARPPGNGFRRARWRGVEWWPCRVYEERERQAYAIAREDQSEWPRIVMKFGGTSVADVDRIRHVAPLVKRHVDAGDQVAVVVSAMAGETNKLVTLGARSVSAARRARI